MGGFLLVLHRAGWHPGAPTAVGSPLHHAYQQATTVAWLGIVACQIGTAFAARTDRASLRAIGVFSNPVLLVGVGVSIVFALTLVYTPFLHPIFGTTALGADQLLLVAPFPLIVWGADEFRRLCLRRWGRRGAAVSGPPPEASPAAAPVSAGSPACGPLCPTGSHRTET